MKNDMIRFHFCKAFIENIKGQEIEDFIYRKILENEKRSDLKNVGSISTFTGSVYALKTSKPKSRTIIEERNVSIDNEEVKVFFIREIVANGNFDHLYGKVIFPQLKSGDWVKYNPLPEKDIEDFIKNFKVDKIAEKDIREFPPDHMTSWLSEFNLKLDNEVFETEEWVKYALNDLSSEGMIDKYVYTFRIVIEDIINNDVKQENIKEQNGIIVYKTVKHNMGILYSTIELSNDSNLLVLYNGAHVNEQKEYWEKSIEKILQNDIGIEANQENVSRNSFRSYPKWTIGSDELWFAIQKSREYSNLSLTREQIEFFRNFKFPHYINGQAGSGKSTMLYYLFSNAYYFKCADQIKGDILFLTENEKLLENTKNSVYDLLANNPEFNDLSVEERNNSDKCFNSFKKFLLSVLSDSDRERFDENKYLNFSIFKMLYENSNLPKHVINKYSAEESWFTIITYIYGYEIDKIITSDQYESIVKDKSRIITKDKFKDIEENVLPFYNKLINDEGYWDKLKIIRFIEKNIKLRKSYCVLICDEAQDFCRVELRFILRLSEYLKYDLSKTEQVPIVFAGDPNQTVNPTGYRQDEMTSMLYEELKEIAKFDYYTGENVYNPTFNYRSTQPVVSLANFVQYHRMKNLGIKQVHPQEAKRPDPNIDKEFNVFLNYDTISSDHGLKRSLVEYLKYKIFIIPVDSQEKYNYIQDHEILSLIDKVEVKTSVEAKGAEYKQVVLYGFGEYFLKILSKLSEKDADLDEYFQRRYFFNKLYVGLTRAQSELLIIDSKNSEIFFWKKLVNEVDITHDNWKLLDNFKDKTIEYNTDSINHITKSTPEDAYANAIKDKLQGIYDNNPARLKVAATQFFKLGTKYNEEGYECLALSEQIKGNWKAAAEYYLKPELNNKKLEEAADCLFKGRHFKELISKFESSLKSPKQDVRIIISRLISGEKIMNQDVSLLQKNKDGLLELFREIDWREELITILIDSSKFIQAIEYRRIFVEVLESIATSSDIELWKEIGNLYFEFKNYQRAIDAWTEIDFFENNKDYYIAQIELARSKLDFEGVVIWLDESLKLEDEKNHNKIYDEILKSHSQNDSEIKEASYYLAVYKSALIRQPRTKITDVGIQVEMRYSDSLIELGDFYEKLLLNYKFEKKVVIYLIERWAKVKWKLDKSKNELLDLLSLNQKYLNFSEAHKVIYTEFTEDELVRISELPQTINWVPSKHFQNIVIQNFRRFVSLTINNIGQFNLIVGDNNVGKTTLLEALLFSEDMDEYFTNLAFAHIDRKNLARYSNEGKDYYSIKSDYIRNDFIRKNADNKELKFTLSEKRNLWEYSIRSAHIDEIRDELKITASVDTDDFMSFKTDENDISVVDIQLVIKRLVPEDSIKSPLISFGKGFGRDLAQIYYEKIEKNRNIRTDFLKSMKTFIPNIERIIVNTEDGEIDIEEIGGYDEASSLHQYGEGANKLFRILVQIALQKGNRLLIDEIDAGIHFSHFPMFWKTILEAAKENDVQIFATTHNIECVKYFKEILREDDYTAYQNFSRIITLRELPNKNIKAYTRIFDEFEYELDNELEIRGGDL